MENNENENFIDITGEDGIKRKHPVIGMFVSKINNIEYILYYNDDEENIIKIGAVKAVKENDTVKFIPIEDDIDDYIINEYINLLKNDDLIKKVGKINELYEETENLNE